MAAPLAFVLTGLIVGAVARLIKPGKPNLSLLATLGLGLAGSLVGGIVASLIGSGDIFDFETVGFIVAVIAAVLLIGRAERLTWLVAAKRGVARPPSARC